MDVLRLDPATFLPDALVEGYSSMIWTERYTGSGEFEMTTSMVEVIQNILPVGSLISLMDSPEVMVVETRSIETNEEGHQELKLAGRSFAMFPEDRVMTATVYNEPWQTLMSYKASEFAGLLLWNHMVNATGEDPTKTTGVLSQYTAVPNVVVTDSAVASDTAKVWWLEQGEVGAFLRDRLFESVFGLRCIRPSGSSGAVLTFDTTRTATRGTVTRTQTSNITKLRMDIYNGLDKTYFQTARPPVIFHYESGHIDSASYLYSHKEHKSMAVVATSQGPVEVWPDTTPPPDTTISGRNRKVLYLDGGTVSPAFRSTYAATWQDPYIQKGRAELQKHNIVRMFDGAISPVSPYIYRKDYSLGDVVTLMAQFGFEDSMLVSEYIRTFDTDGDRGYPGLSSIWNL